MTDGIKMMTIRQFLLSGWSLLILIGITIAANALFMQQTHHPAPFYITRIAAGDAGEREAQAKATIRSVQTGLRRLGYYSGYLDGIAGPETEAAVRQFETAARLAVTGRADAALLDRLNQALSARSQNESVNSGQTDRLGTETASLPDPMVAAIQRALSDAAYGPLTSDGVLGGRTTDAIMRFRLDQGMPVTGSIDDDLIDRLIEIGAMDGDRR